MLFGSLLTLTAAVAAIADPIIVPITRSRTDVPSGVSAKRDAAFSLNRLRLKSGGKVAGSAVLPNEQNEEYIATITLSDGQTYSMDLDTGSSDVWLRGPRCTTTTLANDTSCLGNKVNTKSTGIQNLGLYYVDTYGLGVSAGKVYKGDVTLGGLTSTVAFGVSYVELSMAGSDGLLGLAYDSLAAISQVTPYTNVTTNWFDNLKLKTNAFGFYLSNYNDGDNGEVSFGGYDSTKYTGDIAWFPLVNMLPFNNPTSPGWYTFSMKEWTWSVTNNGNTSTGNLFTGPSDPHGETYLTIADTGTTLMIIPTTPANDIAAALGAVYDNDPFIQGFTVPCTNNLPDVNFHVGGKTFSIPSSIYTFDNGPDSKGNDVCILGIIGGGDASPGGLPGFGSIFGDIFTRAYYTMFDKDNSRVGFAKAVHPTKP